MKTLKIIKPDDWHVHFREDEILKHLVYETSKIYKRAIVMPNLKTPITNLILAKLLTHTLQMQVSANNFVNRFREYYLRTTLIIFEAEEILPPFTALTL